MRLSELTEELMETLEENKKDILSHNDPDGVVGEYIDGVMPIYTSDILELAKNDLWLGVDTPDFLAYGGEKNAIGCIGGLVYQELSEKANDWLNKHIK